MHSVTTVSRRDPRTAAYAAGLVLAVLVAQHLAHIVNTLSTWGGELPMLFIMHGLQLLILGLPLALGVFLSLYLIAPVLAEHRMAQVVARSFAAAGIGAAAVFVASFLAELMRPLSEVNWFANSLNGLAGALAQSGNYAIVSAAGQAINSFIDAAPVVVLAGVCLWFWLTKRPAQHPAEGILDEV